jgi:hypothetical protein
VWYVVNFTCAYFMELFLKDAGNCHKVCVCVLCSKIFTCAYFYVILFKRFVMLCSKNVLVCRL